MKALRWFGLIVISLLLGLLIFVFYFHFKYFEESYALNAEHRSHAPGQFVNLNHGFTHYHINGPDDGPVVVLIHGFSIPAEVWGDTAKELADAGFRVIRYDLYGRGYSDRPRIRYDHRLFVGQLVELLDALEIDQPVQLVGLSMGGAVTMHTAASYPERVQAAVLIAPLHQPLQAPPIPEWVGYYLISGFYVPRLRSSLQADFWHEDQYEAMQTAYNAQLRFRGFTRALTSSLYAFTTEDHPARYRETQEQGLPVMLIWGTQDNIVPYSQHAGVIENAQVVNFMTVDGAGHTPHLEHPSQVNFALIRFLNGEWSMER